MLIRARSIEAVIASLWSEPLRMQYPLPLSFSLVGQPGFLFFADPFLGDSFGAFDLLQCFAFPAFGRVFLGFVRFDHILLLLDAFDLLSRVTCRFEVFLHGVVQSLEVVVDLQGLPNLLTQHDRLAIVDQSLDVIVLSLGRRVAAVDWPIRVVLVCKVQVVLRLFDLLLDRVHRFVRRHQLVGFLNLVLLLLEVRIRVVELVSEAHELGLLVGQTLGHLEVRGVRLHLRLNEPVHPLLPPLLELPVALLLVRDLVYVDVPLRPLAALSHDVSLVLEEVIDRQLLELLNFRCFVDDLLCELALQIVYRHYVPFQLSVFVLPRFLCFYLPLVDEGVGWLGALSRAQLRTVSGQRVRGVGDEALARLCRALESAIRAETNLAFACLLLLVCALRAVEGRGRATFLVVVLYAPDALRIRHPGL